MMKDDNKHGYPSVEQIAHLNYRANYKLDENG